MLVVTRSHDNLQSLLKCILLLPISLERIRIIPVNAKEPATFLLFNSLKCLCLILLNWVKLCVVLFCALVIGQDALKFHVVLLAVEAEYPLYEPWVVLEVVLAVTLESKSHSEADLIEVYWIINVELPILHICRDVRVMFRLEMDELDEGVKYYDSY